MIMGGDRVQTGSAALWSISRVQHQSRSRGDDGVRLRAFSHAARNDDLPLQIRQPSQQSLLWVRRRRLCSRPRRLFPRLAVHTGLS